VSDEEFDIEDLRYYSELSPKEKLEYLEKMLRFLARITPEASKRLSRRLDDEGL